ncbi:MAG: hypothetical protein Q8R70_10150 [Methanoregula sp.]|nr:hypothetical protein [Methanoregula sp.]
MNFPLPFFVLISAGTGSNDSGFEIYLNRSGINSIDLPRGNIQAVTGSNLKVKFVNRGAPIHITISSANASKYTDFFHENLYIVDESVLTIPLFTDIQEGFFNLEIIAGYGVMKTTAKVDVIHPPPKKPIILEESPIQPVSRGRPHLLMVMMGIALIVYTAWLYTAIELLNICAFIILIVGALFTWYLQR